MNRTTPSGKARLTNGLILTLMVMGLFMAADSAFGLGFSLTQIGGTATNGQGVVGDTVTVSVDFTIEADELMLGVFPTLWWDQAGGNVIDVVSAIEAGGVTLGGFTFNSISSSYLLFENSPAPFTNIRSFSNGNDFGDTQAGTNYLVGFESVFTFTGDDAALALIVETGAPGSATIHLGEVTFRLAGLGSTTIGFFSDPASTISSLVIGPRGISYPGDSIEFTDLPVSAIGLGSLQIVVVPEPSTALMFGLGLAALATKRRRS